MNSFAQKVLSMVTVAALVFGSLWFVADNRYMPRPEITEKYIQTVNADERYVQQKALYGALRQMEDDRNEQVIRDAIERLEAKKQLTPDIFNDYDQYQLDSYNRKLDAL